MNRAVPLLMSDIKAMLRDTLQGLEYLHTRWIMHRDLKANNLLMGAQGLVKIADFGLARDYASPTRTYTPEVVTLWYRAPELFYRSTSYTASVDIWSAGCVFAELLRREPFMAADSDIGQLDCIFRTLGTPSEAEWPVRASARPHCAHRRRLSCAPAPDRASRRCAATWSFPRTREPRLARGSAAPMR